MHFRATTPTENISAPQSTDTYGGLRRNAEKSRFAPRGFGRHFATKSRRPRRQGRHQFPPPRPTPTAPAFKSQHTALLWAPAKRRRETRRVPTRKSIPCPKRLACPRYLRATKYSHSGCQQRNVGEKSVRHKLGCVRYFATQQRRPKRLDRPKRLGRLGRPQTPPHNNLSRSNAQPIRGPPAK